MMAMDQAKRFGDNVVMAGRNAWVFGMGAFTWAQEETVGFYNRVMEKGEEFDKSETNVVHQFVDKANDRFREVGKKVEDVVEDSLGATLNRAGIPSRKEIRTLIQRVEQLSKKVDTLAKKS